MIMNGEYLKNVPSWKQVQTLVDDDADADVDVDVDVDDNGDDDGPDGDGGGRGGVDDDEDNVIHRLETCLCCFAG